MNFPLGPASQKIALQWSCFLDTVSGPSLTSWSSWHTWHLPAFLWAAPGNGASALVSVATSNMGDLDHWDVEAGGWWFYPETQEQNETTCIQFLILPHLTETSDRLDHQVSFWNLGKQLTHIIARVSQELRAHSLRHVSGRRSPKPARRLPWAGTSYSIWPFSSQPSVLNPSLWRQWGIEHRNKDQKTWVLALALPLINYVSSLHLIFLICEMEITIPSYVRRLWV